MRRAGRLLTINRFAAPILGGYLFAYGFVAMATLAGFAAGLTFEVSRGLAWMMGLLVYLIAMMWGFTRRGSISLWLILGGGGAVMALVAYFLSQGMAS